MLQISEIVKKTDEMFDLFNAHFYHGALTRPAITVSPDGWGEDFPTSIRYLSLEPRKTKRAEMPAE